MASVSWNILRDWNHENGPETRPVSRSRISAAGTSLYWYSVLNSMYRLSLVDSLVNPANNKGFDMTALSGVRRDVMPPQLKSV